MYGSDHSAFSELECSFVGGIRPAEQVCLEQKEVKLALSAAGIDLLWVSPGCFWRAGISLNFLAEGISEIGNHSQFLKVRLGAASAKLGGKLRSNVFFLLKSRRNLPIQGSW